MPFPHDKEYVKKLTGKTIVSVEESRAENLKVGQMIINFTDGYSLTLTAYCDKCGFFDRSGKNRLLLNRATASNTKD